MEKNKLNLIINEFNCNAKVFKSLLSNISEDNFLWKQKPGRWCLLEIICHLYDEEQEDFRARIKHVFKTPEELLPSIDPTGWVKKHKYINQNYKETLNKFLDEREQSVKWLKSLKNPEWENAYNHPEFGKMTAKMFLTNWLAHDYLHIRQILHLKFEYLKKLSDESLAYAGEW